MNNASHDSAIMQFYDILFERASSVVKRGAQHAPIVAVLHASGIVMPILTSAVSGDERAAPFKAMAARSDVVAAAFIAEVWYVDAGHIAPDSAALLRIADERRLHQHPDRKEVIVISIMTASRQALMIGPIDRKTNTVEKPGFQWIDQRPELISGQYVPLHARSAASIRARGGDHLRGLRSRRRGGRSGVSGVKVERVATSAKSAKALRSWCSVFETICLYSRVFVLPVQQPIF